MSYLIQARRKHISYWLCWHNFGMDTDRAWLWLRELRPNDICEYRLIRIKGETMHVLDQTGVSS